MVTDSNPISHALVLGIHWQTRTKRDRYGVFSVRSEHLFSVNRRGVAYLKMIS